MKVLLFLAASANCVFSQVSNIETKLLALQADAAKSPLSYFLKMRGLLDLSDSQSTIFSGESTFVENDAEGKPFSITKYTIAFGPKGSNKFVVDFKPLVLKSENGMGILENVRYIYDGEKFFTIYDTGEKRPNQIVIDYFGDIKNTSLFSYLTPWSVLTQNILIDSPGFTNHRISSQPNEIVIKNGLDKISSKFNYSGLNLDIESYVDGLGKIATWSSENIDLEKLSDKFDVIYNCPVKDMQESVHIKCSGMFADDDLFSSLISPIISTGDIIIDKRHNVDYVAGENPEDLLEKLDKLTK